MGRAMHKRVFGLVQSDQGLHYQLAESELLDTTDFMNGEQRPK